jgi:hypothetical protein
MVRATAGIGTAAAWVLIAMAAVRGSGGVPPVSVPAGDGSPVITDGTFTAGEWDDALTLVVNDGVTLYLKEHRGVLFVGVRSPRTNGIGPSELSLAGSDGVIRRLHVSAALAELVVPADGPVPTLRLGFTSDWYANEQRRDDAEFARLQKEGRDPISIMQATTYPSDGIEFAIRRSKIPGQAWRLRLWASALSGGRPGMVAYPPDSDERATDGWLQLQLR